MQRLPRGRRTTWGTLLTTTLLSACHDTTAGSDPRECQQTYEFSNSGCFEVQGQVIGTAGQALAGIFVGPRYRTRDIVFTTEYATTDTAGQFRFRASRMLSPAPHAPGPDTLSIYVIAADPRSAGVDVPAKVRDSVLTVVTVAPVGSVPVAAVLRIALQVP